MLFEFFCLVPDERAKLVLWVAQLGSLPPDILWLKNQRSSVENCQQSSRCLNLDVAIIRTFKKPLPPAIRIRMPSRWDFSICIVYHERRSFFSVRGQPGSSLSFCPPCSTPLESCAIHKSSDRWHRTVQVQGTFFFFLQFIFDKTLTKNWYNLFSWYLVDWIDKCYCSSVFSFYHVMYIMCLLFNCGYICHKWIYESSFTMYKETYFL